MQRYEKGIRKAQMKCEMCNVQVNIGSTHSFVSSSLLSFLVFSLSTMTLDGKVIHSVNERGRAKNREKFMLDCIAIQMQWV